MYEKVVIGPECLKRWGTRVLGRTGWSRAVSPCFRERLWLVCLCCMFRSSHIFSCPHCQLKMFLSSSRSAWIVTTSARCSTPLASGEVAAAPRPTVVTAGVLIVLKIKKPTWSEGWRKTSRTLIRWWMECQRWTTQRPFDLQTIGKLQRRRHHCLNPHRKAYCVVWMCIYSSVVCFFQHFVVLQPYAKIKTIPISFHSFPVSSPVRSTAGCPHLRGHIRASQTPATAALFSVFSVFFFFLIDTPVMSEL